MKFSNGEYILLKIDGYSFKRSLLPWMTLYHLGWKATIATASDLIAKGGKPQAFLVSIGVRPDRRLAEVEELVKGVYDAAASMDAWLAGGDTNGAEEEEWIDVAGIALTRKPIDTALNGCVEIYTTVGRYGLTSLAFDLYRRGLSKSIKDYPEAYKATTLPEPRLRFLELVERVGTECIVWASDVSDGLLATLSRLSSLTGHPVCLENLPPIHPEVEEYARRTGLDVASLVLNGGEEYEIVFGVKRACITEIEKEAYRLGLPIARIGSAGAQCCSSGTSTGIINARVRLYLKTRLSLAYTRWDQLRGWS